MADYVVTPANVLKSSGGSTTSGVAGEAVTQGDVIFLDGADSNKVKLADANVAAKSVPSGIALNAAGVGQPVVYLTRDADFAHGLTGAVAGDILILSANPGKIAPAADNASTWFTTVIGVVKSATKAQVHFGQDILHFSGVAKA